MTEHIALPGPEPDWGPATAIQARGTNPAHQHSAATTGLYGLRMRPLALLATDIEAIAGRLRLLLEDSWDGLGNMRVAFFVLNKTDYALTCHDGDPGTTIWIRRSGPRDPAEHVGRLLDVLGVGIEAVSYSTHDGQIWSPKAPPSWRRRPARATISHEEFWYAFKTRPGMYVGRPTYAAVAKFVSGYDFAVGGALLDGLGPWLAAKFESGGNLMWEAIAVHGLLPNGRPPEPWPAELEQQLVEQLLALIDEFFDDAASDHRERPAND